MNISIDHQRLSAELEKLASFSDVPAPAVTRIVFSDADMRARTYLKKLCGDAGLTIREDAVGNIFARYVGFEPDAPAIGTGSHIDAIPHSGRYDGTVGVLGGLEAIRALQHAGVRPRRSIELLIFTSEEPTRFGIGCLGSRLIAGTLDAGAGERLKDRDGKTLDEVRNAAGFGGNLSSVRRANNYYDGFVELHIEQGPLLERHRIPLGIVKAIAAPASLRMTIDGEGGHAGAVLMPDRHDAFMAAAEIALELESIVKSTGVVDSVGTVGVCNVFPGAVNSIPSRVQLEIDLRDTELARRDESLDDLKKAAEAIRVRRGVGIEIEVVNADHPATSSPTIVDALTKSCSTLNLQSMQMVSRAYHDSLFMSRICPVAMLFIPCRNGVSHRPDEFASPEDIAQGALVLAHTLAALAQ